MDIGEKAVSYHKSGFNCAQSVFAACGQYTGMDEKIALSVSCGFGGGLRSGEVCGAISGAVMALGMVFPYNESGDQAAKDKIAALAKQCVASCKEKCGAVTCRDLLALEGKQGCNRFIKECAEIAEEMIKNNQ